jgi:hypothetical protein
MQMSAQVEVQDDGAVRRLDTDRESFLSCLYIKQRVASLQGSPRRVGESRSRERVHSSPPAMRRLAQAEARARRGDRHVTICSGRRMQGRRGGFSPRVSRGPVPQPAWALELVAVKLPPAPIPPNSAATTRPSHRYLRTVVAPTRPAGAAALVPGLRV